MKAWLDYIPLILFFTAFKLYGIFPATAVLIGTSITVYGGLWLKERKLEKSQWFTLLATIAFGSITLLLHDETWLKWKAPVINWCFALVFLGSQFVGDTPMVQRMLGQALEMPRAIWLRLNMAWVVFFGFSGAANAYAAFHFPKYWVDFKVFGSMAMLIVFMIAQLALLSRYFKSGEKA